MATTYTWKIDYLDTKLHEDTLEKVVKSCRYTVTGVTDDTPSIVVSNYGYANFEPPTTENFLLYEDITEEEVLNWVWSTVDKETFEAGMENAIDQIKNPPTVILENPWQISSVVSPVEPEVPEPEGKE